jgi:hypothetical protein
VRKKARQSASIDCDRRAIVVAVCLVDLCCCRVFKVEDSQGLLYSSKVFQVCVSSSILALILSLVVLTKCQYLFRWHAALQDFLQPECLQ